MPVMRALWLHYPDDPTAVACPDQFLWGRDILVIPVAEKEATTRTVYLPRGTWYDFWTGEKSEGGRQIERRVDLETMPLYVRAGTILPLGSVRQHTSEKAEMPTQLTIYPGADGSFLLYEDDGVSFNYRKGEWMGLDLKWKDAQRSLTMRLASGSRMLPPARREFEVRVEGTSRTIVFDGKPLNVSI
jgi:alpha-glucosidase/alpha-D-xyloside xylohydrolase